MSAISARFAVAMAFLFFFNLSGPAISQPPTLPPTQELTETEQIVHVLNRLGYGPRPGDIDKVRAMGIEAYIEEQLGPASIPDPVADTMLADLDVLEMSLDELREAYPPLAAEGMRQRMSAQAKMEALRNGEAASWSPATWGTDGGEGNESSYRRRARTDRQRDYLMFDARYIRAVHSERQLLEMMVDFWMNHFNIRYGDSYNAIHVEEQVVRPLALGNFEDLLFATARHPAMLEYLDNWRSTAPAELVAERIETERESMSMEEQLEFRHRLPFLKASTALNENYGRELMELHTLGVDGGYTQEDVIEVAKCFTGWTIVGGREEEGRFGFDPLIHVPGDKVVMGQVIESGGVEEGEQVLKMLAHHPSTARFISFKLVRRFVADDPPEQFVEAAARAFERSGGDIREVLRAIFLHPEFLSPDYHQAKLKKPLELVASSLRAVDAEVEPYYWFFAIQAMRQMGEQLYARESPDGWPDVASEWLSTNSLMVRLRFAFQLASGELFGITPNLEAARTLLLEMGVPDPSAEQMERSRLAAAMAREAADKQAGGEAMMGAEAMAGEEEQGGEEEETEEQAMGGMQGGGAGEQAEEKYTLEQLVVATMVGSPQFQKR